MFDHVELKVRDVRKSTAFYAAALEPLGIHVLFSAEDVAGFGTGNTLETDGKARTEFLLEKSTEPTPPIHFAFVAPNQKAVDLFHASGMAAGGEDNGKPGLRPDYHPGYYAAFLRDPDGHNVEAVCHKPAS